MAQRIKIISLDISPTGRKNAKFKENKKNIDNSSSIGSSTKYTTPDKILSPIAWTGVHFSVNWAKRRNLPN